MKALVLLLNLSLVAGKQSCTPWGECFDDPPEQLRPHFWIGNEPMCNVEPSDCNLYGFEYDVSHPRGPEGEKWCFANNRIRCVSPEAPPLSDPTPANQLVFASYNIFERDYFISHDGQRERTCRIPIWLAQNIPDVDVITFQEGFMGGCFHNQKAGDLRALLEQHGFLYHTDQVRDSLKPQPGGIFMASRWPIMEEDQFAFKQNHISWDMASAKGVFYVKILKTVGSASQVYHVMGTHLIAGNSNGTRNRQAIEWRQFVENKNIPSDEPVLYAGDINAGYFLEHEELMSIFDDLNVDYNEYILGDLNATAESIWNDVRILSDPEADPYWLDHVMYSRDHLQPISATQQAVHAKVSTPFPVCWCEYYGEGCNFYFQGYMRHDHKKCPEVTNLTHLSDHNPVIGRFVF